MEVTMERRRTAVRGLVGSVNHRVLRGGSWGNGPRNLRSANRYRELLSESSTATSADSVIARTLTR